jgi:hypothetical protein
MFKSTYSPVFKGKIKSGYFELNSCLSLPEWIIVIIQDYIEGPQMCQTNKAMFFVEDMKIFSMCEKMNYDIEKSPVRAAFFNHLNMLKYMNTKYKFGPDVMDCAAEKGNFEMVKWLHSINAKCTIKAVNLASAGGFLQIVKFLIENREEGCSNMALINSVKNNHFNMVKYLYKYTYTYNDVKTCIIHAKGNILIYLLKNKWRPVKILSESIMMSRPHISDKIYKIAPEIFTKLNIKYMINNCLQCEKIHEIEWLKFVAPHQFNMDKQNIILYQKKYQMYKKISDKFNRYPCKFDKYMKIIIDNNY